MKKYVKAAKQKFSNGTKFYKVTIDDVIKYLEDKNANVWVIESFKQLGWDAINWDKGLFGSSIISNVLYICDTDGNDIYLNGKAVDPEAALEEYTPDELSKFISDATPDIVNRYITEYEIMIPEFDKWALDMLKDSDMSFTKMCKDATEFDEF